MTVKTLIELLNKCDPNALVMYDANNALYNNSMEEDCDCLHFGVHDVLIGTGTLKGAVYLTEEKYED